MGATREVLHQLVDALTEHDVEAARRVLEGLVLSANDELAPADEAKIEQARAAVAAGAGVPADVAAARLRAKFG